MIRIIYKNFQNQCDLVIAYAAESYWFGSKASFNLLVLKDGVWLKGVLSTRKCKNDTWTKPKVLLEKVDPEAASRLVKFMDSSGFFKINRDSLNITERKVGDRVQHFSISDGVNYKFEILSITGFEIIEAYAPEHFLEKIPEMRSRETFIRLRDLF